MRRVAGELGVCVERDDVPHAGQDGCFADDQRKRVSRLAPQQRVQGGQLAALPLVAHPHPFMRIPEPRAVEEEESVATVAVVLHVERLDPLLRPPQECRVAGHRLLFCVLEIRQEREVHVVVPIGQVTHL